MVRVRLSRGVCKLKNLLLFCFPLSLFSCLTLTKVNSLDITNNIYLDPDLDPYPLNDLDKEIEYFRMIGGVSVRLDTLDIEDYLKEDIQESEDDIQQANSIILEPELQGETLKQLEKLAREADQPFFYQAKARGFSLPIISKDGEIVDFYPPIKTRITFPAPGLNLPAQSGVPRVLPNQLYKDLAKQTYSLLFLNSEKNLSGGTAFLIDYQLSDDQTYPKKFFFATNIHVWDDVNLKLDEKSKWGKYKSGKFFTEKISLTRLKAEANLGKILPTTADENYFEELIIDANLAKVRTVFMGLDFLKSSPRDWTGNINWKSTQEMADLAIFEVEFNDEVMAEYIRKNKISNLDTAIARFTNCYVTRPETRKFKLGRPPNLQKKLIFRDKEFLAVGFPGSKYDDQLDPIKERDLYYRRGFTRSIWINKPKELFASIKEGRSSNLSEGGYRLTASRSYRSFMHQIGIADLTVISPKISSRNSDISFFEITTKSGKKERFFYYGLAYIIDNFAAGKGASGSPVIDSEYNFYSIINASDLRSSTGISTAFRSPGFSYNGYYGNYNLEAYDLIYGGFKNQKDSYRDSLIRLYGKTNIKTNLFPGGVKR